MPRIVTVPSRDRAFAEEIQRLAEAGGMRSDDEARARFEAAVREVYPNATVRAQADLARTGDPEPVWYVTNREPAFRIDTGLEVPLPPVDAFTAYVERVVEWQTAVRLTEVPGSSGLVGRVYAARYEFMGLGYTGHFRVTAATPPESVALEADGSGISVQYVTRFAPTSQATTLVAVKGDYSLPDNFLARIADRLFLERSILRDIERAHAAYRELCQALAERMANSS